ncbi:MAG: hypothetical protein Q8N03_07995 [Ignavibacteria bacterium]|nr:hypothetical protein [Ignavibacteria bacterium]
MIHEIGNFVVTLKDEFLDFGADNSMRDEGLYSIIKLDNKKVPSSDSYRSIICRKKTPEKSFDFILENQLKLKEYYSECIEANRYLDTGIGGKKIHSAVPYAIWFKYENIGKVKDRFNVFFSKTLELIDKKENEREIETETEKINQIKKFCEENLLNHFKKDIHVKELKKGDYVKVFFDFDIAEYRKSYERYLAVKVFNKEDQGKEFGQATFLNGAPDKKPYLIPKTTFHKTNLKISKTLALQLEKFRRLLTSKPNKKLPNPLPIFIDKDELNNDVIRLFNRDGILKFHEIIHQLYEKDTNDISDYYIINWANTKNGLMINDVDYVSKFIYWLKEIKIDNILGIKKDDEFLGDEPIKHIFQFERLIDQKIFYRIQKNTGYRYGSLMNNYFSDDLTPPKGYELRPIVKTNLLRFRKAMYDYIYKSQTDAITGQMFYEIVISTILDDIKTDEKFNNAKYIQEKLNILFSLNELFDKQNNNFKNIGDKNMASLIPEFQNNLRRLFNEIEYHITSDGEFAFAAGQLIYYVLTKSQTSSKTHSLLEPFISKNDPQLFKLAITRGIEQYKHAFEFGRPRFEKLTSEVLGYDCKTNIKELLPILLAGYFSQSLIFENQIINKRST